MIEAREPRALWHYVGGIGAMLGVLFVSAHQRGGRLGALLGAALGAGLVVWLMSPALRRRIRLGAAHLTVREGVFRRRVIPLEEVLRLDVEPTETATRYEILLREGEDLIFDGRWQGAEALASGLERVLSSLETKPSRPKRRRGRRVERAHPQ